MGANQSSGTTSAPSGGELKTSYYELLAVERTASDEEIKKAYRKKALELHPDRNYGDVERATALFAEVQAAYEVLSDNHERAWYDAHEGDILGGGDGGTDAHFEHDVRITTADDIARMMSKFHGRVDYSDSPSGFFGFLRDTFATLAREEEAAADWEGTDVVDYPSFGHKDDTYEDVVRPFYNIWSAFSTRKSFAWKDRYRYSEAPDRRVRRIMEKENKRFREEGIREFNEAVRTLLSFVRKRDPRYTPNTQSEEERAKAQRAAAAAQAARSRAAREAKMQEAVPEWATTRNEPDEQEEEEEESEEEQFECVACHKTFKSERQYDAHEKSKKHQKAIQTLKRKMQKENRHLNLDEDLTSSGVMTPASAEGEEEAVGAAVGSHIETEEDKPDTDEIRGEISGEPDEELVDKVDELKVHEDDNEPEMRDGYLDEGYNSSDEDDEYASRSEIEDRLTELNSVTEATSFDDGPPEPDKSQADKPPAPKLGKAAQKRAKRAEKQAAADQTDLEFKCAGCEAAFPSKTQLFQHISGFPLHATLKSQPTKKGAGKKR